MKPKEAKRFIDLVHAGRWAALATVGKDGPLASMVAYAPEVDFSVFYLHLSGLARHTDHLLRDGRGSLVISEPEAGVRDPQTRV